MLPARRSAPEHDPCMTSEHSTTALTLCNQYEAEVRDEHVTELDYAPYLILALANIKTSQYFSKIKRPVFNLALNFQH